MTIIHKRAIRQQPNGQWCLFWEAYLKRNIARNKLGITAAAAKAAWEARQDKIWKEIQRVAKP